MKRFKRVTFGALSLILIVIVYCAIPVILQSGPNTSQSGNIHGATYAQGDCTEYCAIYQEYMSAKQKYDACTQNVNAKCDAQTTRKAYNDYITAYNKYTQYLLTHQAASSCSCQSSQNQQNSQYPCKEYWLYWNQMQGKYKLYTQCENNPACSPETKKGYYDSYQEALNLVNLFISKYGNCPDWCTDSSGSTGSIQPPATTSLIASFTMSPENPSANESVIFSTTSVSPGKIVQFHWYLDGRYLQEIGNVGQFSIPVATPGNHTVILTVTDDRGNTASADKTFQVTEGKGLALKASADPDICLSGSKVTLQGNLTYNGQGLDRAAIEIKIRRPDGQIDGESAVTGSDGTYGALYEVPTLPLKNIAAQKWTVDISAIPAETTYGSTSTSITINVVPVYLQLHSVQLTQVIEPPIVGGKMQLVAERDAGLRAMVSCPSLKNITTAAHPEVKVKLVIGWAAKDIKPIDGDTEKLVPVGAEPTPVDFVFKLNPGLVNIGVMVDPDNKYMLPSYSKQMYMQVAQPVEVIDNTKTLTITYFNINTPGKLEDLRSFYSFCKQQTDFIKDVYPTPRWKIKFKGREYTPDSMHKTKYTLMPRLTYLVQNEYCDYWGLELVSPALLEKKFFLCTPFHKAVGVVPQSWFAPGDKGVCQGIMNPGAACVSNEAWSYVTGHEIGHLFGLRWREEYKDSDPKLTLGIEVGGLVVKDGRIFNLSDDNERGKFLGQKAFVNPAHCMMGTTDIVPWICKDDYAHLLRKFADPPGIRVLLVSGLIHRDGTITMDNCYLMDDRNPDPPFNANKYIIECLSPSGAVLYSDGFSDEILSGDGEVNSPPDEMGFVFTVPFPADASRVVIKKDNKILAELNKTPKAPQIRVLAPNGGENFSGQFNVDWEAHDTDGGMLSYNVLYSNNGGDTWEAVEVNLTKTSCTLDAGKLPGGNRCLVKVIASDGINTSEDHSDRVFAVSEKGPVAGIIAPINGASYEAADEILLYGFGYDQDEGEMYNPNLQWSSSIDGSLGAGDRIKVESLSPGSHTISLTVRDSNGLTAEDEVTITVGTDTGNDTDDTISLPASSTVVRDWDKSQDWFGFARGGTCIGCGYNSTGGDLFISDRGADSIIHVFESPGIIDMGSASLDSIREAPQSGYIESATPIVGHSYVVRSQGKYGKIYIEQIRKPPDAPITEYFIKWQYQTDGSRYFSSGSDDKPKDKPKGGCFIATAAYGTPIAEEINILRKFRDRVLLQDPLGGLLVDVYYAISPGPADFIAKHEILRTIIREALLTPIVTILNNTSELWNERTPD